MTQPLPSVASKLSHACVVSALGASIALALTACEVARAPNTSAIPATIRALPSLELAVASSLDPADQRSRYEFEGAGITQRFDLTPLKNEKITLTGINAIFQMNGEPIVVLTAKTASCSNFYLMYRPRVTPPQFNPWVTCPFNHPFTFEQIGPTKFRGTEVGIADPVIFTSEYLPYKDASQVIKEESGRLSEIRQHEAERQAKLAAKEAEIQANAAAEATRKEQAAIAVRNQAGAANRQQADEHNTTLRLLETPQ